MPRQVENLFFFAELRPPVVFIDQDQGGWHQKLRRLFLFLSLFSETKIIAYTSERSGAREYNISHNNEGFTP